MVKNLPSLRMLFNAAGLTLNGRIAKLFLTILVLVGASRQSLAQTTPILTYSNTTQTYTAGTAITALTPTADNISANISFGQQGIWYNGFSYGLTDPTAVAIDGNGIVYVASGTSIGAVTNGGTTTNNITYPTNPISAITADTQGDLFVASASNSTIHERYANNTSAERGKGLVSPRGVAVDAAGNIFVTCSNGIMEILAGSDSTITRLSGGNPVDIAVDINDNLYYTDSGKAYKLVAGSNSPANFGSSLITTANGIAVDGGGNIFVGNQTGTQDQATVIMFEVATGIQTTVAVQLGSNISIAVDSIDNVYVTNGDHGFVERVSPNTGLFISGLPPGLNFDTFFQSIEGTPTTGFPAKNYTVIGYDGTTNYATATLHIGVISADATLSNLLVNNGAVSPAFVSGTTTYTQTVANTVSSINITPVAHDLSATVTINGTAAPYASPINEPLAVNNNVFNIVVASSDGSTNITYKLTVTRTPISPVISYATPQSYSVGSAITTLSPANSNVDPYGVYTVKQASIGSGYNIPSQLAVGHDGTLYVPNPTGGNVLKVSPNGTSVPVGLGGGSSPFSAPVSVALDSLGNLYIADYSTKKVYEIPAGSDTPVQLATDYSFSYPSSVAADAKGNVFVTDYSNHNVILIPADRSATKVYANSSDGSTSFIALNGIAVDGTGNVYVTDANVPQITQIPPPASPGATISTNGGTVYGGMPFKLCAYYSYPDGVTADASGNIYVNDPNANGNVGAVYKLNAAVPCTPTLIVNRRVIGMAVDLAGDMYVASRDPNLVQELSPVGGYFISKPLPKGLSFDYASGNISGTPIQRTLATTYTVTAYNAGASANTQLNIKTPSADTTLSALTLSAGILTPVFNKTTFTYTVPVYNNTSSITLTPTLSSKYATLTVQGNATTSGVASQQISLNEGDNVIPVTVTADNGNTGTYTVTVHRKIAPPAISYPAGNQTFYTNLPITSLTPTITGVVAPGDGVDTTGGFFVTPALPAGLTIDNNTGIISGTPTTVTGTTTYTVTAYNEGGGGSTTQNITVQQASPDASLSNLTTDYGAFTTPFSPGTTSYNITLPIDADFMHVIPTTTNSLETVTVNGTPSTDFQGVGVRLKSGPNLITVVVTAQDGTTQQTYTVNAFQAYDTNADLSYFNASYPGNAITFDQPFDPNTTNYTATVPATVTSIIILPALPPDNSKATVNGLPLDSTGYATVTINPGSNVIPIVVTAEDGTTMKTYTITITRPANNSVALAVHVTSIAPNNYFILTNTTPGTSDVVNYTAPYWATYDTITPVNNAGQTFKVNGVTLTPGDTSAPIPLTAGTINTYTVAVTAEDGTTNYTYTFNATRPLSGNDTLSTLGLSNVTLVPAFNSGQLNYTADVDSTVASTVVTAAAADNNATLTVNGVAAAQNIGTQPINLVDGANTISATVIAQNGFTQQTYTVNLFRHTLNLSSFSISSGALSAPLTDSRTSYFVGINSASTVYITASTFDPTATITVNGSPIADQGYPADNNTVFNVAVTSADGTQTKNYTFTTTLTNSNLSNITISPGALDQTFSPNTYSYTASEAGTVSSINLIPSCTDLGATITINGVTQVQGSTFNIPLTVGSNTINMVTLASGGGYTQTYTLVVSKQASAVPSITYAASTFPPGVPITPLAPTGSGVFAQAYNSPVTVSSGYGVPAGVAVDAAENVYAIDATSGQVYKTPAGGSKTAIGTSLASANLIALDAAGNIFVASNAAINKISADGSTTTTVLNNPSYASIKSIAIDQADNIYFINSSNHTLYKIPAGSSTPAAYAGSFTSPTAVAIDASGAIWVADYINYSQGYPYATAFNTVLNNGAGISVSNRNNSYIYVQNFVFDAAGNIYAASPGNKTILELPADQNSTPVSPGTGTNTPYYVAVSPAGNIYYTDYANQVVQKITPAGGYYLGTPLPRGLAFSTATGTISGTPTIPANAKDYLVTGYNSIGGISANANITIYSPDVLLTGVNIYPNDGSATLSPAFSDTTYTYTVTVDAAATTVNVFPTVSNPSSQYAVNGPLSGGTSLQQLFTGKTPTPVTITVSANNGSGVSGTYTLNVIRALSTDANLGSLSIDYGMLSQNGNTYTAAIGNLYSSTNIYVTAEYPTATVAINGTPLSPGETYLPVNLNLGDNTFNIAITAADGVTVNNYVLIVTRSATVPETSTLVDLEPSIGTLTPAFDPGTINYTVTLPNYTPSLSFTPTATNSNSNITVNNNGVGSGNLSSPITLTAGNNTIAVLVTSQDGTLSTTYTVTVINPAPILPTVSYASSSETYTVNTAIAPLTPASSNVGAPGSGYSANPFNTTIVAPFSMARDAAGNLYTTDFATGTLFKVSADGQTTTPLYTTSSPSPMFGVAVDANGVVYATDPADSTITMIPAGGGTPSHFSNIEAAAGIAVNPNGGLYVTSLANNSLYKIAANGDTTNINSSFNQPYGLALDSKGNVYVSDQTGTIKEFINGTGAPVIISAQLEAPYGLTVDSKGNVYVADLGLGIVEIPVGGDGTPVPVNQSFGSAGLVIDPSGIIYAGNINALIGEPGGGIEKLSPTGGYTISPALPAGLTFDSTTGTISGKPTVVSPATPYTITGFDSDGSAVAVVNITVKQVAVGLASLRLNPYSRLKAVSVTDKETDYTTTTPVGTTSVTVTPKALGSGMNITVNGTPVTSNTASAPITLNADGTPTIITTVVTAPTDTVTYVVAVNQAPLHVASLTSIVLNPHSTLQTVYATATTTNYSTTVPAGTTSVTVTPKASGPGQVIYVNGSIVASGTPSAPITLNSDFSPTVVQARVYAPDGTTVYDYLVTINQVPLNNANLSSIALNPHSTLKVVASTATETDYTTTAPAGTTSVTVTAKASDPAQTITVGGNPVTSGTASSPITLNTDGTPTMITTVVTAPDGVTTNTYVIQVSLPPLNVASLSSIVLNPYSTLKVTSATATETDYTTTTPAGTTSVTVTPKASGSGQTITVDGSPVTSGAASAPITLNTDGTPTMITTVVTAPDGTTTNTYVIAVSVQPSNIAALKSIVLNPYSTLKVTATNAIETDYTTTAPAGTTSVTVTPTATGSGQTILVAGTPVTSGTASGAITLNPDGSPTLITTIVTAPDGITSNNYVITVNQVPAHVAGLNSIVLNPHSTLKVVSTTATETDYTTTTPLGTTSVTVTPTASGAGQTITVNGTPVVSGTASGSITLNTDFSPTIITTVVTAPDGTTTNTYVITVNQVPMNVASLTSIVLTPHSTLKVITVTATETDYTTTAAAGTTSVTVTPKASGVGQMITVDETPVVSGTASGSIALNTDGSPTIITTVVTAPDGTTTNTYVITINQVSTPSPLDAVNSIAPGAPVSDVAVNDGIVVHQALSPNGDGINDVLTIDGLQKYSSNRLSIMDSNGVAVFSAQNYDNVNHVFDGHSNKGVMQAPGTYFYVLQYKDGNATKTKTGFIVLKY